MAPPSAITSGSTASSTASSASEQLILHLQIAFIVAIVAIAVALLVLGKPVANLRSHHDDDDDHDDHDDGIVSKKIPLPPGSYGWPWIGETLDYLRKSKEGQPWAFIDERVARYKSPTFKTRFLGFPVAVLTGPAGNKAVCSNAHMSWPTSVMAVLGPESLTAQVCKISSTISHRIRSDSLLFRLIPNRVLYVHRFTRHGAGHTIDLLYVHIHWLCRSVSLALELNN
jgi:hypothetical protein